MLDKLFDAENPLMRALSVVADLMILNAIAILCSLPIVTFGPAMCALNDVTLRITRGEESYLFRGFLQAMRSNFKNGLCLGLLFLGGEALVVLDFFVARTVAPHLRLVAIAVGVIILAVFLYAFALQARFVNTVPGVLKNALSLTVAYFPKTLWMVVCCVALWVASLHFFQYALPIVLLFGFSLPCYICAIFCTDIFRDLEKPSEPDATPVIASSEQEIQQLNN